MSAIRTYKRILLTVAVALVIALAGAFHPSAWASVAQDFIGINLNVPSTTQQAEGTGTDVSRGGSEAVLGVNLNVPEPVKQEGETGTGTQSSSKQSPTEAILGINLNVPSTIEQTPTTGGPQPTTGSGSEAVLGINLIVGDVVPDPDDPESPGMSTPGKQSGTEAILGINLNVPSTVLQAQDDDPNAPKGGSGSEAVLGINLKVGETSLITFDANGGDGQETFQPSPNAIIDPDESKFYWPGRHIVSWHYTDKDQTDENKVADGVGVTGEDAQVDKKFLDQYTRFYAKWQVDDIRWIGEVELHMVEPWTGNGNENQTQIGASEAAAYGLRDADGGEGQGALDYTNYSGNVAGKATRAAMNEAYVANTTAATTFDNEPIYTGYYFPGGDDNPEGETLYLPNPDMTVNVPGTRDGKFAGWFKTVKQVGEDGGYPVYEYSDEVRYDSDAKHWYLDKFDIGAGLLEDEEAAGAVEAGTANGSYKQVLYAKWETGLMHPFRYHLNAGFDTSDGDTVSEAKWADGTNDTYKETKINHGRPAYASDMADPSRVGYTFGGWYSDEECTKEYRFGIGGVYDEMDVYAKWNRNTYTATYDAGEGGWLNGSHKATRTTTWWGNFDTPTDPEWVHHSFLGWYVDEDGSGEMDNGEALFDFDAPVQDDVSLTAAWSEYGMYTVKFDANGGVLKSAGGSDVIPTEADGEETYSLYIYDGEKVPQPAKAPERAADDDGTMYVLSDLDGNGSYWFIDGNDNGEYDTGENIWNFAEYTVVAPVTLKAAWETTPIDVTFDANGGHFENGDGTMVVTVNKGQKVEAPVPDPEWDENHTFNGWYTDSACETKYDFDASVTDEMTLYAGWTAKQKWNVTFYGNDADGNGDGGWTVTGASGDEWVTELKVEVEDGDKVSKPADPTWKVENKKKFAEKWYTEATCENEYDFDTAVTSDLELYAGWINIYTVTFDATPGYWTVGEGAGATQETTKLTYVEDGKTMADPPEVPTRDDENGTKFKLDGWYTKNGTTTIEGTDEPDWGTKLTFSTADDPVVADVTIYAKWVEDNDGKEYEVIALTNGGVIDASIRDNDKFVCLPVQPDGETVAVTTVKQMVKHGESAQVPYPKPTKAEVVTSKWNAQGQEVPGKNVYTFDGWFIDADGDGKWDDFVDVNGNGLWDETFTDMNGNGVYDEWNDADNDGEWDEGEGDQPAETPAETRYYFNEAVTAPVTVKANWIETFVPNGTTPPTETTYRFAFVDGIDHDDEDRPGGANDVADVWREAFTENVASGLKNGDAIDQYVNVVPDEVTGDVTSLFAVDEDGEAVAPHRAGYRFAGFYGSHVKTKVVDGQPVQIFDEEKYFDVEYVAKPIEGAEPGPDGKLPTRLVATWVINDAFKSGNVHVWTRTADSKPVAGSSERVVELYAKWELRLDVTVPVSVGVGANGNDQSILTPAMGAFKIKSRTVMPVAVDQIDLATSLAEMDTFFEEKTTETVGGDGVLPSTGKKMSLMGNLGDVLHATKFWLAESDGYDEECKESYFDIEGDVSDPELFNKVDRRDWTVVLPVRSDPQVEARPDFGFAYNERSLEELAAAKRAWFKADAFDVWAKGADDDACEPIALKLGLAYPKDKIQVVLFGEGDRTLSHLVFTVTAKEYQKQ